MNVPVRRVKMELSAQTDPTNTPANALQVFLAFIVSWTSTSVCRALVITVCVVTVWPPSPVTAGLDTPDACVKPTSTSA